MITGLDHIVLTVRSIEASCSFYIGVLGCARRDEPGRPTALMFGGQKINLHAVDRTFEPKAAAPTPGSGDICLLSDLAIDEVVARLKSNGAAVELGPVPREGARGPMTSVYLRDPDGNLVEIASYEEAGP